MLNPTARFAGNLAGVILALSVAAPHAANAQVEPETAGPYNTLVIRDATIIDGTGSPARGPVDIVIKKNVITDVV